MYCKCDKQEINTASLDTINERCKNCKKVIKRKSSICLHYLDSGYCKFAETKNYSQICRVKGVYGECKNGKPSGE